MLSPLRATIAATYDTLAMEMPRRLVVAHRQAHTEVEGPGARYALWVAGCSIRCAGCCNPEMFARDAGVAVDVETLLDEYDRSDVEGITLLGGEPFEQAEACADFASAVSARGGSVMVFSGYVREDLEARRGESGIGRLLDVADLLVDGPYERDSPETRRRWIGSHNQRMHFLSTRYSQSDPRFSAHNQIVIRLQRNELEVHGWPGQAVLPRTALRITRS
jgi:anaerobic ribonucleoside-triphosphate reductase activating protein